MRAGSSSASWKPTPAASVACAPAKTFSKRRNRALRRAYLAGPDVFLPHAVAHAAAKVAICARHGIEGLPPLNEGVDIAAMPPDAAWRTIFAKDLSLMEAADLVIANLTPFRGASADSGTLVELGWFFGRGKPIFAYSNSAVPFADRSRATAAALPDPVAGLQVEGFGLPDNLMIPGSVIWSTGQPIRVPTGGRDLAFDSLELFETCVAAAAAV